MEIFQRLNDTQNLTVVIVTHELDIAQYAKRAMEFRDGRLKRSASITGRLIASEVLPTLPSLDEEEEGTASGETTSSAPGGHAD